MVLFPCWLLPSLPLLELEEVVTVVVEVAVVEAAVVEAAVVEAAVVEAAVVEAAVEVESVLSPGQTTVQ